MLPALPRYGLPATTPDTDVAAPPKARYDAFIAHLPPF